MVKIKKVGVGVLVGAGILLPLLALAQLPQPNPESCSGIFCGGLTLDVVGAVIQRIAQFLITVAIIVAVIYIIWGGITYMASGSNEDKTKKAKQRIYNGIIGAAVILAVGVILQTVARLVTGQFFT